MPIFQKSVIQKHIENLDSTQVEQAYQKFLQNYNAAKIAEVKTLKEEEYQDGFLRDVFVDVLGYTLRPDENYNLHREFKNQTDGKKADGAIIKDGNAVVVIELKSTKTKDLKSITQQAFNYKNNQPECKYVITSNFQKLRFYIDYANEYEEFDLFQLTKERFELLYLILNKDNIFADIPLKLKEETKFHDQEISDNLYKDYSRFKRSLYENLTQNHPNSDKLTLFKKSQKLLDRFLFILFAEDSGLLPPNSISRIVKRFEILKEEDAYKPIYEIFKQYFGYMNIGRKGKTAAGDIPAYNGGLFYEDLELDAFKIDDDVLITDLLNLSEYDFNTEVDVNILGHIFEHSLNEIEEITAQIEGTAPDKSKSKRKKDGVFYTPKYITQYIVENTVGTLCTEKRTELGIDEIEFDQTFRTKGGKLSEKGKKLYQKLIAYKEWLITLKIIDPACGSGAFLNQALNFLIEEHATIDDVIADLTNSPLRLFDVDKSILENNLFGVDINEESVEIAKLSLWLRTAQKGRKLSSLNNNIKCGNSLIDDPEIAGDKAFNWNTEFKDIMDNGGFDCVIGNPPYGVDFDDETKRYLLKFDELVPDFEIYIYFISLYQKILKQKGVLSYIFPNTFLSIIYGKNYRSRLFQDVIINEVVDLSKDTTFVDAAVRTIIFTITNWKQQYTAIFKKVIDREFKIVGSYSKEEILQEVGNLTTLFSQTLEEKTIIHKIRNNNKLLDFHQVSQGYIPYRRSDLIKKYGKEDGNQIVDQRKWHSKTKLSQDWEEEILGKDVKRYHGHGAKTYVKYGKHLASYVDTKFFKQRRILIREITSNYLFCAFLEESLVNNPSLINIIEKDNRLDLKYTLVILNSKLIGWFHNKNSPKANKGLFPKILINDVRNLPLKDVCNDSQQPFIEKADNMIALNNHLQEKSARFIKRIQDNLELQKITKKLSAFYDFDFKVFVAELKKQKVKLTLPQQDEWEEYFTTYKTEINQIQNEIATTDAEIDSMVYGLYGLSEEEVAIVEGIN